MIAGGLVFAIVVQFLFELICCADILIHLQVTLGLVHCLELRMADLSWYMLHTAAPLVLCHLF